MITIVLQGGETEYGVVGRPPAEDALAALDKVRSDILLAVAAQQAQQPEGDQEGQVSEEELAQLIEKEGPTSQDIGLDKID